MIPIDICCDMIDRKEGAQSICMQCELLGLSRSTLYYSCSKTNDRAFVLMKELDMLYLEDSTRGTLGTSIQFIKPLFDRLLDKGFFVRCDERCGFMIDIAQLLTLKFSDFSAINPRLSMFFTKKTHLTY